MIYKLYFKNGIINFQTKLRYSFENYFITNHININMINNNENSLEYLDNNKILINWRLISKNPDAIDIINKHIECVYMPDLCENSNAIKLINYHIISLININFNINLYHWHLLCKNPNAIELIEKYILDNTHKEILLSYYFKYICENPNAIHIIEKYLKDFTPDIIFSLCKNPNAIHIIEKYITNINNELDIRILDFESLKNLIQNYNSWNLIKLQLHLLNRDELWYTLLDSVHYNKLIDSFIIHNKYNLYDDIINENKIITINKSTDELLLSKLLQTTDKIKFIKRNLSKFRKGDYRNLFKNPNMSSIIKEYMYSLTSIEVVELQYLCENINMIDVIEHNLDRMSNNEINIIICNPNIFTYQYNKIKHIKENINKAIIEEMYSPKRIAKYLETNDNIDLYLN